MEDSGVPLAHYRRHKADVLLDCDNCALSRTLPLERVIARLNARGLDGENVGIRAVARYTLGACPRCGERAWSTRPAFPGRPGQDGMTVARDRGRTEIALADRATQCDEASCSTVDCFLPAPAR